MSQGQMKVTLAALLSIIGIHLCCGSIGVSVLWTFENGTQLQLSSDQFARLSEQERLGSSITKRNAVKDYKYLWYMGTVYYDIDARTVDFRLLQILGPAFAFFHKYTCIKWKRRIPGDSTVKDYVVFTMPYGNQRLCNSAVGKQTGRQYINLDKECVKSLALVLHQMTHALGFYHTHSRVDRDKYISVLPQNAAPENRKFFDKNSAAMSDPMGFPYEYKSLMHFDGFKYALGFNPTIKSKIPGKMLGNKQALTVQDVKMINKLYASCQMSCRFKNGYCDQTCHDISVGKVTCSCERGYKLNNKDGRTCYNVDECSEYNGGCEHSCVTHGAWFKCQCNPGFTLDKNGYSCRANNLCEEGKLKCEHECHFNLCRCRQGYKLNADKLSCDDVNECWVNNGGCETDCFNREGSYECGCKKGQHLINDGKSCTDITCINLVPVANADLVCNGKSMAEGTVCNHKCRKGYKKNGGSPILQCINGGWSGTPPRCEEADRCQLDNGGCEQQCWSSGWDNIKCSCRVGFALHANGINCTDNEPPTIIKCPKDIYSDTVPKRAFASVTWNLPEFSDNVEARIISGPVMQDKIGGVFDIGAHAVNYVIEDTSGLKSYCSFKIKVNDVEKPDIFNCPKAQNYEVYAVQRSINAEWQDPSFWDNSENVTVTTDLPADRKIQPRSQEIHYIASDPSGNSVVCTVKVNVVVKEASCNSFPYQPVDGSMQCDQFAFGTQCVPQCDSGYDLTKDGIAPIYSCRNNKWKPDPQPMICKGTTAPLKGPSLYYEFKYKYKCAGISLQPIINVAAQQAINVIRTLCPTTYGQCTLSVRVECTGDFIVINIYTTEPVKPPITDRYMQKLKDNILQNQRGIFFYMPISGNILPPIKTSEGLQAEPKIDFACYDGDKADTVLLKCYSKTKN